MGLVVVGAREVDLVGGDERNAQLVGERDQLRLDLLFRFEAVTLQLDVEVAVEDARKTRQALAGKVELAVGQRPADGAERAAGQHDQASRWASSASILMCVGSVGSGSRKAWLASLIRLA